MKVDFFFYNWFKNGEKLYFFNTFQIGASLEIQKLVSAEDFYDVGRWNDNLATKYKLKIYLIFFEWHISLTLGTVMNIEIPDDEES